jgi:hypothetical protein
MVLGGEVSIEGVQTMNRPVLHVFDRPNARHKRIFVSWCEQTFTIFFERVSFWRESLAKRREPHGANKASLNSN